MKKITLMMILMATISASGCSIIVNNYPDKPEADVIFVEEVDPIFQPECE